MLLNPHIVRIFNIIPDEEDRKHLPKCYRRFQLPNDIKCEEEFECVGPSVIGNCVSKIYKCIHPIIPKADNALFIKESPNGKLIFDSWQQDEEILEMEHGYQHSSHGDSGNGYFVQRKDSEGRIRSTIVAVNSGGRNIFNPLTKTTKCRNYATKLTDEIIAWIKEKDQIHANVI